MAEFGRVKLRWMLCESLLFLQPGTVALQPHMTYDCIFDERCVVVNVRKYKFNWLS